MSQRHLSIVARALVTTALVFVVFSQAQALDKVRLGLGSRLSAHYYLVTSAAEEKGIWRQNGLAVEEVPFQGGGLSYRGLAARAIELNISSSAAFFQGTAGGVPALAVSDHFRPPGFFVWVRADGAIKEPRDLKGGKIGVAAFGGVQHAYARAVARALRLEREIRFVATGGIRENLAALRTRTIDAVVLSPFQLITLKLQGEVRELVEVKKFLPADWVEHLISGHREFVQKHPEVVARALKGIVEAAAFVVENPGWTIAKLRQVHGYSEEAAKIMFDQELSRGGFTKDGRIHRAGLENVRQFLIEFGILARERAPALDEVIWQRPGG